MPLTRRQAGSRTALLIFVLAVAIALIGWLLVWKTYQGLNTARENQTSARSVYEKKQQTQIDARRLLGEYEANKQTVGDLAVALPDSPKLPQILADLDRLSRQSGLIVQSVKVAEIDLVQEATAAAEAGAELNIPPNLLPLKINASLAGGYDAFLIFLDLIERNMRLFDVRMLSTESAEASNQAADPSAIGLTKFNIELRTYYQNPKQ